MNYYNEIKNELINNEINRKIKNYSINKNDLNAYYNVGKLLLKAGNKYGERIIKDYSLRLTKELGSGYSQRNLRNMRQFYRVSQKWQTVSAKLSWSHITELMVLSDEAEINYYISVVNNRNISYRKLSELIKDDEYSRIDDITKNKLKEKVKLNAKDLVKNPIIIKNNSSYEVLSEKILQKLILEDISAFLKELGNGFTFIDNEYPIKLNDRYNYIDLLLYNIKYKCYVVVELKVTELKKEIIGQIMVYMNYIDKNIKTIDEDITIGIIICKKDNELLTNIHIKFLKKENV